MIHTLHTSLWWYITIILSWPVWHFQIQLKKVWHVTSMMKTGVDTQTFTPGAYQTGLEVMSMKGWRVSKIDYIDKYCPGTWLITTINVMSSLMMPSMGWQYPYQKMYWDRTSAVFLIWHILPVSLSINVFIIFSYRPRGKSWNILFVKLPLLFTFLVFFLIVLLYSWYYRQIYGENHTSNWQLWRQDAQADHITFV